MPKYFQSYYSTGNFAKICHTTKETLYHYDEIDLLKPMVVKENGYRYYLSIQYYDFQLIKVLQKSTMSLSKITDFIKKKDNQIFIDVLQQKNKDLEAEKEEIKNMQDTIQQIISMTEYGMHILHNQPFIEECDREHLLIVTLPNRSITDQDLLKYVSKHLHYCKTQGLPDDYPLGTLIQKEDLLNKSLREYAYFNKIQYSVNDSHYLSKPKGLYATILHKGFYDTIDKTYDILFNFIKKKHYKICGNAYEYEIHSYYTKSDIDQYLISISIQIESNTK